MINTERDKPRSSGEQHSGGAVSSASGSGTRRSDIKEKAQARPQKSRLESVGHLLSGVYTGTFKRTRLEKAELNVIQSAPPLSAPERDVLRALALPDRTLGKTRQLMLIGIALDDGEVSCEIMEFAREVLQHHPAFKTGALAGVFENFPEAAKEDRAVQIITSQDYASLSWSGDSKPMTKIEREQCMANALHCLLLFFWTKRRISVERVHYHLQVSLWRPRARRCKNEAEKFRTLITAQDLGAAAITYELLEKQALEQSQRAEAACRDAKRAYERASRVEEELAGVEARRAVTQEKLDQLGKELEEAIQAHENASAHWKDDYEQLRGQVLRRLNNELSLLNDGLHALRRDPPKVHVMLDHAERAIDGLKSEIKRLRGKG